MEEVVRLAMGRKLEARKRVKNFIRNGLSDLLKKNLEGLLEVIEDKFECEKSLINYQSEDFQTLKPFIVMQQEPREEDLQALKKNFKISTRWFRKQFCRDRINESINKAKRLKNQDFYDTAFSKPTVFDGSNRSQSSDSKFSFGIPPVKPLIPFLTAKPNPPRSLFSAKPVEEAKNSSSLTAATASDPPKVQNSMFGSPQVPSGKQQICQC